MHNNDSFWRITYWLGLLLESGFMNNCQVLKTYILLNNYIRIFTDSCFGTFTIKSHNSIHSDEFDISLLLEWVCSTYFEGQTNQVWKIYMD